MEADPINFTDPLGLTPAVEGLSSGVVINCIGWDFCPSTWVVTGNRAPAPWFGFWEGIRINPFEFGRGGDGGGDRATQPQTQRPNQCQLDFLTQRLSERGLPTDQLKNLKFVSGLDAQASGFTKSAFNSGAQAVTQGSTVYVQPGAFNVVANFRSPTTFEEAYHTAQFAMGGGPRFHADYGIASIGGILSGLGWYKGNVYEAFAKGAASEMFASYKYSGCK